jgi:hypothetical protein
MELVLVLVLALEQELVLALVQEWGLVLKLEWVQESAQAPELVSLESVWVKELRPVLAMAWARE